MHYEPTNTPAMARTSNLNEELGQVNTAVTVFHVCFIDAHVHVATANLCFSTHVHVGEIHFL